MFVVRPVTAVLLAIAIIAWAPTALSSIRVRHQEAFVEWRATYDAAVLPLRQSNRKQLMVADCGCA